MSSSSFLELFYISVFDWWLLQHICLCACHECKKNGLNFSEVLGKMSVSLLKKLVGKLMPT